MRTLLMVAYYFFLSHFSRRFQDVISVACSLSIYIIKKKKKKSAIKRFLIGNAGHKEMTTTMTVTISMCTHYETVQINNENTRKR